ncbi:sensor histidine kinase [candidate division KSB1 bacterium]
MGSENKENRLPPELIRIENIANMGQVAGQIGHEISNILTILKGKIDLYIIKKNSDVDNGVNSAEEVICSMKMHLDRMQFFAKSLQQLEQGKCTEDSEINAVSILASVIDELKEIGILKYYTIITDYCECDITLKGNSDLLSLVFRNLLLNAHHAMDGYGTLTIRSSRISEKEIKLTIADTGCGIKPEYKDNIFDIHFSTKPDHRATGIGLSVAKQIIELYGGTIDISSKPGEGAIVSITISTTA